MSRDPKYGLPVSDREQPSGESFVFTLLSFALLPLVLLIRLMEEISGEGRWYRKQRAVFECRTGRPVASFSLPLSAEQVEIWDEVRRAVGESVGVDFNTIYPDDSMATLGRMQFLGPDPLDVLFHLEAQLDCKIEMRSYDEKLLLAGTFHEYAMVIIDEQLSVGN